MIEYDTDKAPEGGFDIAIVALGYETRCQWVWSEFRPEAKLKIAAQFGFLTQGKHSANDDYFSSEGFTSVVGVGDRAANDLVEALRQFGTPPEVSIFVDISSMSREMIANIILAVNNSFCSSAVRITAAYAPSKFVEAAESAPIRIARPITRVLSGWSSMPEKPLGAVFGLGCEGGLALGAMQVLEPDNAWLFAPVGLDDRFIESLRNANEHIEDIFDVTRFAYDIQSPTTLRAKYESLLNSIGDEFRLITIPFGPKLFAWTILSSLVFSGRDDVGVWTFSSAEQGHAADREAEGPIIWHTLSIAPREVCPI